MKKLYSFFALLLVSYVSFADNEQVCVNTGSSIPCTASELGYVSPCATLGFLIRSDVPLGFARLEKYEWFVNGVLVKTSTTTSDPILPWDIKNKTTNVYCQVTYIKSDGTLSAPKLSNTFTPNVKDLNFDIITTSTPSANYGCTTNAVSYSLNTFTCTSFCSTIYTVTGSYTITWQPPTGWVQTSISANGNNVSFTPDATSGGLLTATIHLPCGYTDTRIFNVGRIAQPPTFTTSTVQSCTSSAAMSINPTCGATGYTYTIVGDPGVTFSSNGLQTFTSAATTINFSIAGGSSVNSIKAKANYPNSISSAEASATLTVGVPQPGIITFSLIDPTTGKLFADIEPIVGATSYNWYKNGALNTLYHGTSAHFSILRDQCNVEYDISVEAVNSCGTSLQTHANAAVPCDYYLMSPNPATSSFTVEAVNTNAGTGAKGLSQKNSINKILITDKMGNVLRQYTYSSLQKVSVNISGLKADTYFVKIFNGKNWVTKQLSIAP